MTASVATWPGRAIEWNRLNSGGTIPKNVMWGDCNGAGGPFTPAGSGDVNLFNPIAEASARIAGTVGFGTVNYLADQVWLTATQTASGTRSIREVGVFDSVTASPTTTVTASASVGLTGSQVVGSTTGFPASGAGNFYCQYDTETILASTVDGTHLNFLTRGMLGSSAATHSAGATISIGGDGGTSTMSQAAGATLTSAQTSTLPTGGSLWIHADFAVISLNANDSIAFTIKDELL